MNIKIFNKTLLVAMLGVSLVACDNSTASTNNSVSPTEVSTEDNNEQSNDMIDQSMKDADENKAADSNKDENKKEETKKDTTIEKKDSKDYKKATNTDNPDKQSETSTVDVKKDEDKTSEKEKVADNTTAKETEAPKEDTSSNTQDGSYVTTLIASKQGARDPEMSIADAYYVEAQNGVLTVKGSLDYRANPENYDNVKELENNTYSFTINENTKFQAVGGMAEPQNFTAAEFNEYYKGISESGLALIIEVKDGVVQTASFSS